MKIASMRPGGFQEHGGDFMDRLESLEAILDDGLTFVSLHCWPICQSAPV